MWKVTRHSRGATLMLMGYLPIENYAVVGNLRTVALVGINGSIDWFCFPNFDSPSIFGAILDERKGGRFRIGPASTDGVVCKQMYWPDTNVLITRFLSDQGVAEILDYMPVGAPRAQTGFHGLIRHVRVVRGRVMFRLECNPAFNYGRDPHQTELVHGGATFHTKQLSLALASDRPLTRDGTGVVLEFSLGAEETLSFELHELEPGSADQPIGVTEEECKKLFEQTVGYWRDWLAHCTYIGRWREMVRRSALVLKLLVFAPTGAIVAAPTCSLPEALGGTRNWDYRYTWLRDAAFTVYSLIRIGFTEEAAHFMEWMEARCRELDGDGGLQVLYGIDGRREVTEEILAHFEGYCGSAPVRIGNDACKQLQLDIYGELMDSVYLYNKYGTPISYEMWSYLRRLMNWLCTNWKQKDEAIWEVRSGRQHFVYSRVMCWVALDRALRLAEKRSFPADRERWLATRDEIYDEVQKCGWSEDRNAFTQYYGSESLDASALIMPLVFFMSPTDPRMISTIDAIRRPPSQRGLVSDSLVYRYNVEEAPDGLRGREGTFNMCTFWLVEALTRAGKVDRSRLADARLMFERMLGYANHVGLFAEQTGPRGEALGNFPQAFTHLALISSAFNLDRALGGGG
ncbi:MAG TPA: glycoside hydrolase family 15 protein [Bryobacteraceae bacterium]|nr:glycoside hydrolase family 15 protein [Bryobacteraceae bacterium]